MLGTPRGDCEHGEEVSGILGGTGGGASVLVAAVQKICAGKLRRERSRARGLQGGVRDTRLERLLAGASCAEKVVLVKRSLLLGSKDRLA